jgi:hypothetical protein
MSSFTYKTYLPTKKIYLSFRLLSGREYLIIGKYLQNNDTDSLIKEFTQLISECCLSDICVDELSTVDIFCILLNMRIMSVSQTFDFEGTIRKGKEVMKGTQKLDLYDILDKVTNHNSECIRSVQFDDKYTIKLGVPRGFQVENVDSLVVDVIEGINVLGREHDMQGLTSDEKNIILDELSGDVLSEIVRYIRDLDQEYRIKVFEGVVDDELSRIELKLFDNSLFEFIKAMFNCNLQEQYYIRYIMVKRLNFNLQDVEDITPIDTQNYINLYKEELEEERKANEKQSGDQKPGMSLPNPGFEQ